MKPTSATIYIHEDGTICVYYPAVRLTIRHNDYSPKHGEGIWSDIEHYCNCSIRKAFGPWPPGETNAKV